MRRLTTALGIAFLATLVGCGKTEGTKPTGTSAAAPSSAAQAKLPTTATVKGIGICCGRCEQQVEKALSTAAGIGDVQCDVDKRTVTFKAKDGKAANEAWGKLVAVGFWGQFEQDDKSYDGFTTVGNALSLGKFDEIRFKGVHVCCKGCEGAITEALKGTTVSFEGQGTQKTVTVKGKDLDAGEVKSKLMGAGYGGAYDFDFLKKK